MRATFALFALVLGGCYWHGWPIDDATMCPSGPSYPISPAECARRGPRGADAGTLDGGVRPDGSKP